MGADAVVGIDIDYEVLGANNGMLMVTASGIAVNLDTKEGQEEPPNLLARSVVPQLSLRPKCPVPSVGRDSLFSLSVVASGTSLGVQDCSARPGSLRKLAHLLSP